MRISHDPPLPWLAERELEKSAEIDRYEAELGYPSYDPHPETEPDHPERRFRRTRLAGIISAITLLVVALVACVLALAPRWWTPDESAFIRGHEGAYVYEHVTLNNISRYMIAAAISHEDIAFLTRTEAFEWGKYVGTAESYLGGDHDIAGGSTIPQQLVKNLYLTPSTTPIRKAVEALIATPTAVTLSKPRMMELYLNYAQFGQDIFGICAASWYYFGEAPWDMSLPDAAQLASILPLPSEARRVDTPTGGVYVLGPKSSERFHTDLARVTNDVKYLGSDTMMKDIGIKDDASAHAGERSTTASCSTMPEGVRDLLRENGYGF